MRIFLTFFGVLFGLQLNAQLTIKSISPSKNEHRARTSIQQRNTEPIQLPFWDDFSITSESPDSIRIWAGDTLNQWNFELSKDVFVNTTLAINPPSYGVATFDGLDANGAFHGDGVGLTDQLVSDTIDLQGVADVVLSFYWQAGGNVEIPEVGDSLVLQFYSPNIETNEGWETVWLKDGEDLTPDQDSVFTQVVREIPSTFLTQKFLFRFQSYGDQDGPFDAWHVDWVYLNKDRAQDDFYYVGEFSINSEVDVFLNPFRSVPINQIEDLSIITNISATSMNLNPEPDGIGTPLGYVVSLKEKDATNEIFTDSIGLIDLLPFFNPDPFKITAKGEFQYDSLNFNNLIGRDSVVLEATLSAENPQGSSVIDFLDGTDINLRINDTVRTNYILHNYYAYDDGTAEFAAGTNINGAQVAVQYWLEQPDTLTSVDIYFPNIDPSSDGTALELQIFKELDSDPVRSQNITVRNGSKINEFTPYKLNVPLVLDDTFYVGYQQSKNEYVGVGFDRSNPEASQYIYENRTGVWERNTRLTGALMIRPVFEKLDSLVLGVKAMPNEITAYPNPTDGIISLTGSYQSITVMDFSGKVWYQGSEAKQHDLSSFPSGLYLLTIHRKEGDQTLKIIKK